MSFSNISNNMIYRRERAKKKKKGARPASPVKHIFTSKKFNSKDKFFDSMEWRNARYMAFRKMGRTCALCGQIGGELHVDHVKPRSKYPHLALNIDNLQILCRDCNLGKGHFFEDDWRKK